MNIVSAPHSLAEKAQLRETIRRQVAEFLSRGGRIRVLADKPPERRPGAASASSAVDELSHLLD